MKPKLTAATRRRCAEREAKDARLAAIAAKVEAARKVPTVPVQVLAAQPKKATWLRTRDF